MPSINQRLGAGRFTADEYYRRALEAYRKRDFDSAIAALDDAIDIVPRKSEYYAARGLVFLEDGEEEKAAADFREALRLFDYEVLALYGLGMLAYKTGRYPEAAQHFARAHYGDQKRPEPLFGLALTAFAQEDLVSATRYMGQALALFESANDPRKKEAARYLREWARLARSSGQTLPVQPPLPLSAESGDDE